MQWGSPSFCCYCCSSSSSLLLSLSFSLFLHLFLPLLPPSSSSHLPLLLFLSSPILPSFFLSPFSCPRLLRVDYVYHAWHNLLCWIYGNSSRVLRGCENGVFRFRENLIGVLLPTALAVDLCGPCQLLHGSPSLCSCHHIFAALAVSSGFFVSHFVLWSVQYLLPCLIPVCSLQCYPKWDFFF